MRIYTEKQCPEVQIIHHGQWHGVPVEARVMNDGFKMIQWPCHVLTQWRGNTLWKQDLGSFIFSYTTFHFCSFARPPLWRDYCGGRSSFSAFPSVLNQDNMHAATCCSNLEYLYFFVGLSPFPYSYILFYLISYCTEPNNHNYPFKLSMLMKWKSDRCLRAAQGLGGCDTLGASVCLSAPVTLLPRHSPCGWFVRVSFLALR